MMGLLMQIMGWVIGVPAVVFGIMFFVSLRADKGRILFAATLEMMKGRSADWRFSSGDYFRRSEFTTSAPIDLSVMVGENPFNVSVAAGDRWRSVDAGFAWSIRLHYAAWNIYRRLEKIKRLNAICDGIEGLAEKNVIRLRDRHI